MVGMDENSISTSGGSAPPNPIRASDAEREQTAARLREAADEGRLTLAELDDRLSSVYAARMRHELDPLVADLPRPAVPAASVVPRRRGLAELSRSGRLALSVHAVLVLALAVAVISRWVATGMVFFWPVFPIFWALVSLAVHARLRGVGAWRPVSSASAGRTAG